MKNFKENVFLKIGFIVLLMSLLFIPTSMIKSLIDQRQSTKEQAYEEVGSKWGTAQFIRGPYLSIPYKTWSSTYTNKEGDLIKTGEETHHIHIMPSDLRVISDVESKELERGIYELAVYNSKNNLQGSFDMSQIESLDIPEENIQYNKAVVVMGISDLRGLENSLVINWNKKKSEFLPGLPTHSLVSSGLKAPVELDNDLKEQTFNIDINLKGSKSLNFTPVGKTTDVKMSSNWASPSFSGAFLADEREVTADGFSAHWNVLDLNRSFPQIWTDNKHNFNYSAFGTDFLLGVDSYQKSYRSIEYSMLIIAISFLVFFFIEVLSKKHIHPIQYAFVGLNLVVFFILQLSISEHTSFNVSFVLSAMMCTLLASFYVHGILKDYKISTLVFFQMGVVYSFVFTLIQLEDLALVFGSIGLFMILGLSMFFSRNVDWYKISAKEAAVAEGLKVE